MYTEDDTLDNPHNMGFLLSLKSAFNYQIMDIPIEIKA